MVVIIVRDYALQWAEKAKKLARAKKSVIEVS